jgi:hypothetical protein
MTDDSSLPPRLVRVFIMYDALWNLEPPEVRNVASALGIFRRARGFIETIASDEFDEYGAVDDDFYEGQAVVRIYPADVERALAAKNCPQASALSAAPLQAVMPPIERFTACAESRRGNACTTEQIEANGNPGGR